MNRAGGVRIGEIRREKGVSQKDEFCWRRCQRGAERCGITVIDAGGFYGSCLEKQEETMW